MSRSWLLSAAIAAFAAAPLRPPEPSASQAMAPWVKGEAYGVLVERGPLGKPPVQREVVLVLPVRGTLAPFDLLMVGIDVQSGRGLGAYRVELRPASRQPRGVEPMALELDANRVAFRVQSEGPAKIIDSSPAYGFHLLQVPWAAGGTILPYWIPASNAGSPIAGARGLLSSAGRDENAARSLTQTWRKGSSGEVVVSFRNDDEGPRLVGSAHFRPNLPLPAAGQVLDTGRDEHTRIRVVFHLRRAAEALSLGRAAIAGDPVSYPPEALLDATTEWPAGARDLVADEVLQTIAAERRWSRIAPRRQPADGEGFPYVYELFALKGSVTTGSERANAVKIPSAAAARGALGLLFAGRFETSDGVKLEAWMIPGSDERSAEAERVAATAESSGKLLLRTLLGRASPGLLGNQEIKVDCAPGWYARSLAAAAKGRGAGRQGPAEDGRRGSDAILVRRESDLAPVLLVFYKLSSDLRFARVLASEEFDGVGPLSVVRRSLLERAKDYFLAGGFTAFTQKKGASILLTREGAEPTQIDRLDGRGCAIEFLTEKELPEEPWNVPLDPREARSAQWGRAMEFAVGRSRDGDQRPPRDCVVRRSDGEELLALEAWEMNRPWWSEAVVAYALQNVGVRFRQVVHSKLEVGTGDGTEDLLPFKPPPPPPQPSGNPRTKPGPPGAPSKPKPEPAKPAPPPPAPGTPKTGG